MWLFPYRHSSPFAAKAVSLGGTPAEQRTRAAEYRRSLAHPPPRPVIRLETGDTL